MKKFIRIAFAVVAFAAVGLGSYKAYGSYTAANMSEDDLLMAENIEALSAGEATNVKHVTCYTEFGNYWENRGGVLAPKCPYSYDGGDCKSETGYQSFAGQKFTCAKYGK